MDPTVRDVQGRLAPLLSAKGLLLALGLWIVYKIGKALYRISPLHPLHKFPGPKVAAATFMYEAYYDVIKGGRYGHEIRRMHEVYGPIVRISPEELHVNDPRFVDEVYAGGNRKRDKWGRFMNTSASSGPILVGGFSTLPHDLHRMRRMPMNRFFSRGQMLKLEAEVHDFTQRTCDKMLRFREPFDLKDAFNCYTADIISQYCFGEPMGFIAQEGWLPNFTSWSKDFFQAAYMLRHVTPARWAASVAPLFSRFLGDDMRSLMRQMEVVIPGHIQKAIDNRENGRIFADLIESKQLPDSEKTIFRLTGEGFNLLVAGSETTAAALACISYHLLAQPETFAKLTKALEDVDPLHLSWVDLESRPYMWAVIHEALRLMPGVSQRSPRVAQEEELVYTREDGTATYRIPKGTPVSMTSIMQHSNEKLFPSPKEFIAERWLLDNGQPNHVLEKSLISFSKGTRVCLAKDLAYCELYLMTAALALRVLPRARLDDTTIEDVEYDHDLIVPQAKRGAPRVQVVLS